MNRPTLHLFKFGLAVFGTAMLLTSGAFSTKSQNHPENASKETARERIVLGDPDTILFVRGPFKTAEHTDLDTRFTDSQLSESLAHTNEEKPLEQTRVIQFSGPVRRQWVERITSTGLELIGYIPNNAYLVRGTAKQIGMAAKYGMEGFRGTDHPIKWMGRFDATQKIDPRIHDDALKQSAAYADVDIELLDGEDRALRYIQSISLAEQNQQRRFLKFLVISVRIPIQEILRVAAFDEVVYVGESSNPSFHDERSAQIVAANLSPDRTQPAGPGYIAWLASKQLNGQSSSLIDFSDSGLDRGSVSAGLVHPDSRDSDGQTRVAYNLNYSNDGQVDDRRGHGSLVASIACGSGESANTDPTGYLYGLGVDPFTRFGASRIFGDNGRFAFNLSFSQVVSNAFQAGARISNNSWGKSTGTYDPAAQEYDALTRDAQPTVSGNQEMLFVFSAGNNGPAGPISSPGTAKNVITVGGSENFRPEGWDSCNLDGAGGIGPEGADNAEDILRFSSKGPTADGRSKPDLVAPGTHIYGSASQASFFNAGGLCPGTPIYQPPGQRLYTWSSGTSLAAAHVSGAASLVRRFVIEHNLLGQGRAPSPAMIKAFLINSASYLNGDGAGGNLPAGRQGWGIVDLSRAFDDVTRVVLDGSTIFQESGQSIQSRWSVADPSQPVRVTLVWTDPPGLPSGSALVNDLDLEVTVDGVAIYNGNSFAGQFSVPGGVPDRLNNVECIFLSPEAFPNGFNGNLTITVRAANIAGDGIPSNGGSFDQDFALVVYNVADPVTGPPPPPPIKIPVITTASYMKKRLTITGRDFTAAVRVEINGKSIDRAFTFDPALNSLSIKLKRKKLNLELGSDNQIVLIEDNQRSQPFSLPL